MLSQPSCMMLPQLLSALHCNSPSEGLMASRREHLCLEHLAPVLTACLGRMICTAALFFGWAIVGPVVPALAGLSTALISVGLS